MRYEINGITSCLDARAKLHPRFTSPGFQRLMIVKISVDSRDLNWRLAKENALASRLQLKIIPSEQSTYDGMN